MCRKHAFRCDEPLAAVRCSGSVFAGRLVEASRVPACISTNFARSAQAKSLWDEGLHRRNMEPQKTETEHRTAVKDQRLSCALCKQIRYMSGYGGGGREARGIDAE